MSDFSFDIHHTILYEIYPRSFKDTNGDGVGDIKGIIEKLDYLEELGISAIWITPFYPSPMKDGGYDVSDYCNVDPIFGTLLDVEELIKTAHEKGIAIFLDFVVNHTSETHPWFQESISSRNNPKRDWYIWKDPVNGHEPNNWRSVFGGSAWQFDEKSGQYYLHTFLKEQPDLNWHNPEVVKAMQYVTRFWFDKGVDGFRLDAANHAIKDSSFLDEPEDPAYKGTDPYYQLSHIYTKDLPGHLEVIKFLEEVCNEYKNKTLITEAYPNLRGIQSIPSYQKYYQTFGGIAIFPFNFELISLPWEAKAHREFIQKYLEMVGEKAIPIFVLGNHDRSRLVSRIGKEQAKVAAMLLLTLPGIPVMYYGDELGMQDVQIPKDFLHDASGLVQIGEGRDPERTPMQWDTSDNAGFSKGNPWLPVAIDFKENNVASEKSDPHSFFSLYKCLISFRQRDLPILEKGTYQTKEVDNNNVYAYSREYDGTKILIILNYTDQEQVCALDALSYDMVLSTENHTREITRDFSLHANEGCMLKVR